VAMQGDGRSHDRRIAVAGDAVVLLVADTTTAVDAAGLVAALQTPRLEVWSPVTVTMNEGPGFESLQLWLASQPRPYGVLVVDRQRAAGLVDPQDKFACPTLLGSSGLAYLAMRKLGEMRWQFGAHGFGTDAGRLTADLIDLIAVWDRDQRHHKGPEFTVHPAGTVLPDTNDHRMLARRRHTLTAITWPGGDHR
jgi:protein-L-isoaspartate(D-aspartate) O-methyltransferase